jgi:hypothetical protein
VRKKKREREREKEREREREIERDRESLNHSVARCFNPFAHHSLKRGEESERERRQERSKASKQASKHTFASTSIVSLRVAIFLLEALRWSSKCFELGDLSRAEEERRRDLLLDALPGKCMSCSSFSACDRIVLAALSVDAKE